jgi:hypothetical protein
MKCNIPWMHPSTWKGIGLKLDTIPQAASYYELRKEAIES